MFGGIAFLVNGTMCVGVDKDDLIVRCEKDETEKLLAKKGVRECDLSGGRPMKGWLLVGPASAGTTAGFKAWIRFALARGGGAERLQARRAATIDQGGSAGSASVAALEISVGVAHRDGAKGLPVDPGRLPLPGGAGSALCAGRSLAS